mmetsp:Transcript_18423/g.60479  ORF Transcript_18423/g.60479 Transcript_18423/m.60479 type:complete len:102 (+) Transcript_18423:1131-1436(+)
MTSVAVTLIDGINDSVEQADQLMKLLTPLLEQGLKVCVDLIPYNDIGTEEFKRAQRLRIERFQRHIMSGGFACFVRVTRGDDQSAACGQLATSSKSSRKQS